MSFRMIFPPLKESVPVDASLFLERYEDTPCFEQIWHNHKVYCYLDKNPFIMNYSKGGFFEMKSVRNCTVKLSVPKFFSYPPPPSPVLANVAKEFCGKRLVVCNIASGEDRYSIP